MSWDFAFKFSLVGDTNVGKSHMLHSVLNHHFDFDSVSTIGVEYDSIETTVNYYGSPYNIKITLWDTAGQERFQSIVSSYYKKVTVILIVFDLSQYFANKNIDKWRDIIASYIHPNTQIVLIGNKLDLCVNEISFDPTQYPYPFYQISAKEKINTKKLFNKIAFNVLDKIKNNIILEEDFKSLGIRHNDFNAGSNYVSMDFYKDDEVNKKKCCIIS